MTRPSEMVGSAPPGRREGPRRVAIGVVCVAVLVAVFVFMHSGPRATAVCNEHGLARAASAPSLVPPGARCVGGTESPEVVKLDAAFLLVAPAAYLALGLVALYAGRRRSPREHTGYGSP